MLIDWSLDVDSILQIVAILSAILKSHTAIRERLVRIETRLDYVEHGASREEPS